MAVKAGTNMAQVSAARNTVLSEDTKERAGISQVMARIGAGIESISNRKPESMKAGRKPENSAICAARNWLRASDEIRSPCPSAGTMNTADRSIHPARAQRTGKSNTHNQRAAQPRVNTIPPPQHRHHHPT